MKKLLCFCLIAGLGMVNIYETYAQDWANKGGQFGIGGTTTLGALAELNIANINGTDFETESRTGVGIGVSLTYLLANGPLFLDSGLSYQQQGFKEGDITIKLDYVEVESLVNYAIPTPNPGIVPFVGVGPSLGFNISAKQDFDGDKVDISDGVNTIDFGLAGQAGVDFGRIRVGVEVEQGLSSVFDSESSDAKNINIGLVLTYKALWMR